MAKNTGKARRSGVLTGETQQSYDPRLWVHSRRGDRYFCGWFAKPLWRRLLGL